MAPARYQSYNCSLLTLLFCTWPDTTNNKEIISLRWAFPHCYTAIVCPAFPSQTCQMVQTCPNKDQPRQIEIQPILTDQQRDNRTMSISRLPRGCQGPIFFSKYLADVLWTLLSETQLTEQKLTLASCDWCKNCGLFFICLWSAVQLRIRRIVQVWIRTDQSLTVVTMAVV